MGQLQASSDRVVELLQNEDSPAVKGAAVRALCALQEPIEAESVTPYLDASEAVSQPALLGVLFFIAAVGSTEVLGVIMAGVLIGRRNQIDDDRVGAEHGLDRGERVETSQFPDFETRSPKSCDGFAPKVGFVEGLRRTFEWYRAERARENEAADRP